MFLDIMLIILIVLFIVMFIQINMSFNYACYSKHIIVILSIVISHVFIRLLLFLTFLGK